AQQRNSADNARNVALQVAQDKIEKVRQLDYDQITQANLESVSYADGQFGSYWDFVRNGATKRYTIQYTVAPVPSTAAPGSEKYKKVEIRVTWVAPPAPVKAAVLQTLVYRQYAGPEIASYTVGPPSIFDPLTPDAATIIASPVVVDVTISPEDIGSMNATAVNAADRGWVNFGVHHRNWSGCQAGFNPKFEVPASLQSAGNRRVRGSAESESERELAWPATTPPGTGSSGVGGIGRDTQLPWSVAPGPKPLPQPGPE
ncbi:MAG: hypothetical protein Q7U75_02260, partial [Desulfobacterales bacterium]|nr:hypothetical protein [Desulfobacterales bacterium]